MAAPLVYGGAGQLRRVVVDPLKAKGLRTSIRIQPVASAVRWIATCGSGFAGPSYSVAQGCPWTRPDGDGAFVVLISVVSCRGCSFRVSRSAAASSGRVVV